MRPKQHTINNMIQKHSSTIGRVEDSTILPPRDLVSNPLVIKHTAKMNDAIRVSSSVSASTSGPLFTYNVNPLTQVQPIVYYTTATTTTTSGGTPTAVPAVATAITTTGGTTPGLVYNPAVNTVLYNPVQPYVMPTQYNYYQPTTIQQPPPPPPLILPNHPPMSSRPRIQIELRKPSPPPLPPIPKAQPKTEVVVQTKTLKTNKTNVAGFLIGSPIREEIPGDMSPVVTYNPKTKETTTLMRYQKPITVDDLKHPSDKYKDLIYRPRYLTSRNISPPTEELVPKDKETEFIQPAELVDTPRLSRRPEKPIESDRPHLQRRFASSDNKGTSTKDLFSDDFLKEFEKDRDRRKSSTLETPMPYSHRPMSCEELKLPKEKVNIYFKLILIQ